MRNIGSNKELGQQIYANMFLFLPIVRLFPIASFVEEFLLKPQIGTFKDCYTYRHSHPGRLVGFVTGRHHIKELSKYFGFLDEADEMVTA